MFEKLVALFDGNRAGLGWEELVDLAQHAALGDQFVLRWGRCWGRRLCCCCCCCCCCKVQHGSHRLLLV